MFDIALPDRHSLTVDELVRFLTDCDQDFLPPLSQQTNLTDYARKLLDHAQIAAATQNGELTGIVACYCNDVVSRRAFVSCLAVRPHARHKGLGSELLKKAVEMASRAGMQILELETARELTVEFYKRAGFELTGTIPHAGYTSFQMRRMLQPVQA